MRIKNIHIKNFRGFREESFSFDPSLMVIVGNNTAGKTTLLQAIQVALGAYLKSLKDLPNNKQYRCNFTASDVYKSYNISKKQFFPADEPTCINVEADFFATKEGTSEFEVVPISWWRELKGNITTHSNACAGELIKQVHRMEKLHRSEKEEINAIYPLVLSFGVNRIDSQYRAATKSEERGSHIERAYKSALKESVDFKSAFDWIYRYDRNYKFGREFVGTKEAFLKALEMAIPALSELEVDTNNKELFAKVSVTGMEPSYHTFDTMSDGFKSLICIVAEIAYRCIQLNGYLGTESVLRTPGVVIIDELDLYLHPHWQRHVLHDLQQAFPMIQFIISSHSPFIVQSVKSKNVITLDGVKAATDPQKRSLEEIAISEMNMKNIIRSSRYTEMLDKAEEYYHLVREGKDSEVYSVNLKQQLDTIEQEFSDDPAYVALLRAERMSK